MLLAKGSIAFLDFLVTIDMASKQRKESLLDHGRYLVKGLSSVDVGDVAIIV